jgi:hypothetical protein
MWDNIHTDDYGWIGRLRIVEDEMAVDISSYTTLQYILRAPDGTVTTKTAAFATDGTDGLLQRTFVDGDIDQVGAWQVQARIAKTGAELTSARLRFDVKPRLD